MINDLAVDQRETESREGDPQPLFRRWSATSAPDLPGPLDRHRSPASSSLTVRAMATGSTGVAGRSGLEMRLGGAAPRQAGLWRGSPGNWTEQTLQDRAAETLAAVEVLAAPTRRSPGTTCRAVRSQPGRVGRLDRGGDE